MADTLPTSQDVSAENGDGRRLVGETYRYRIEPRDIDATLRARIYTVGDLILQAANDDADMSGFGVRDLNLGNASWVLSRMAVEMRRLPSRHESIDICTWVSDYGKLFTTRNMTITDSDGIEIGAAVTLWAMIDLDTRRPLDLSPLSSKATSLVDREPPIERPRKIPALLPPGQEEFFVKSAAMRRTQEICDGVGFTSEANSRAERSVNDRANFERKEAEPRFSQKTVVYSDIDFNGHVNSMKYLEWMVDTLPPGVPEGLSAFRFDINYIHEAKSGENLTICSAVDPAGACHFDIRNAEGVSICKAAITQL